MNNDWNFRINMGHLLRHKIVCKDLRFLVHRIDYQPRLMKAMSIHLTSFVILAAIATVFGVPVNSDCNCNLITDKRYPLTEPIVKYRIGIVSDLDEKSKSSIESSTWISYFKKGYLTYKPDTKEVFIEWDNSPIPDLLKSHDSVNDRGAELSELVTYDAKLITVDDKTGWVYLIEKNNNLTNWVKLNNGDGNTNKEMKNEWATVKDSKLYVGSHGRELVNGQDIDYSYMWVKTIDKLGNVEHLNWKDNFIKIRKAVNIEYPGYMAHEAVEWSDIHKRWFFLPRKISEEQFDDSADEQKGTNVLLSATSDFEDIKAVRIGDIVPNRGYSSFKFIPGTGHSVITAISTQESNGDNGVTATFITVFTVDGEILFPAIKFANLKYEGFEFI